MELLLATWLGTPIWLWLTFMSVVLGLLVLDLGVFNRVDHEISISESLKMSAFYIAIGLSFGAFIYWQLGATAAKEYVTGFVVEKSLALDNIFVIAMIFGYFAVPRIYQHRVLFWGILGVIVLRGLMIGFGTALVTNFSWILYIFAAFLIFTGVQMWRNVDQEFDVEDQPLLKWIRKNFRVTDKLHGHDFFVKQPDPKTGKVVTYLTPLFVALLMVEFVDVIFAFDSVPAIFAITTDPFIVYTSNIFAILGLRALFFALSAVLHRFHYLKYALAVLLVFIGSKIFMTHLIDFPGGKFPPGLSLGITFAILTTGIVLSLWKTRNTDPQAITAKED